MDDRTTTPAPMPAPVQRKQSKRMIALIGCAGILGLCVLFGIIGVLVDSDDDDIDDEPVNIGRQEEPSEEQVAEVGETVSIPGDNWNLTVTDVRKSETTDALFIGTEEALGIYIIVDIAMENIGSKSQKLTGGDFTVTDDRNREYEWYSDGSIGYGQQNLGDNINAGLEAPGTMLFDVPEDATGLVLTALDGSFRVSLGDVSEIPMD